MKFTKGVVSIKGEFMYNLSSVVDNASEKRASMNNTLKNSFGTSFVRGIR